jgi:hypothetical protein
VPLLLLSQPWLSSTSRLLLDVLPLLLAPCLLQDLLRFGNSTREYVLLKEK